MSVIEQILDELRISYTLAVFVGLLFTATLVRAFARSERARHFLGKILAH